MTSPTPMRPTVTSPTTMRPTMTSPTTMRPTTVFPTGPPNLNCICVDISLCDPRGIVTISGEGVINPRYGLCPGINQVCCTILATTTQQPTNPPTSPPTTVTPAPLISTTLPPGQIQLCFVCGNTIQCITCGIIIGPGSGLIDPRFPLPQTDLCSKSLTHEPLCQDETVSPNVETLGPLKNAGTSQACYCVKTWMCAEGNVVSPDALGAIDPRFTTCSFADQVCCLSTGIQLQVVRSADTFLSSPERFVASSLSNSFSHTICGVRTSSYAPCK